MNCGWPKSSKDAPRARNQRAIVSPNGMSILDRYLIRETATPFLLALAVSTFIFQINPILEKAEFLLAKGVPALTVGYLLLTLLPQALGVTLPISFLIGLLM